MRAATLFLSIIAVTATLAGCAHADPRDHISKNTGVQICAASRVQSDRRADTPPDVWRYQISLPPSCRDQTIKSLARAAPDCMTIMQGQGKCSYQTETATVFANFTPAGEALILEYWH